jgi:hypothetical protein
MNVVNPALPYVSKFSPNSAGSVLSASKKGGQCGPMIRRA